LRVDMKRNSPTEPVLEINCVTWIEILELDPTPPLEEIKRIDMIAL
jgi:hypothetical protein